MASGSLSLRVAVRAPARVAQTLRDFLDNGSLATQKALKRRCTSPIAVQQAAI